MTVLTAGAQLSSATCSIFRVPEPNIGMVPITVRVLAPYGWTMFGALEMRTI
ncbi:hypothetical protein DPMN_046962 [Dreissena polymorpha]|uniref:Uncharacterized protein n=1 Tax=Dreissena polymorpha TaxID=45954 RepID=A0A9D4HYP1_DREPO|nr:hypothetical protein DPMN_046962 [Dreissena polymorpha]